MKKYLTTIVICFSSLTLCAQLKKDVKDFVRDLVSKDTTTLKIENIDFHNQIDIKSFIENELVNVSILSDSLYVVDKKVILENCRFEGGLWLEHFWFKKGVFVSTSALPRNNAFDGEQSFFEFHDSVIDGKMNIQIENSENVIDLKIVNCKLNDGLEINQQGGSFTLLDSYVLLQGKESVGYNSDGTPSEDAKQRTVDLWILNSGRSFNFSNNVFNFEFDLDSRAPIQFVGYIEANSKFVILDNNKLTSNVSSDSISNQVGLHIEVGGQTSSFNFMKNDFEIAVNLNLGFSLNQLKFYSNKLRSLRFSPFKIPSEDNFILWSDIAESNLGLLLLDVGFYDGRTTEQINDFVSYRQLIKFYKSLYDAYKTNGDIQSVNAAYIKIKDLETNELKIKYTKNPNLNLGFMIQINRILKFYTSYGTNPAKSLVISVYIIFGFACFYFFFPSDWDVTSKSKLIGNFKDFIQKNEKGYIKPFFALLIGFIVSLINAITLSLNAFTTLGFGNIPTKGIARYVCVFQGFLGWFLLSLFTVALINQVSF
jgi:hypothetical protein